MPNIARTKTWNANETLTAADLNAEFDGILTGVNDNALNNDNLNQTDDYLFGSLILGSGLSAAAGDGKLHVHVASAGSVTAHANGNDFVIEGTANPGMSFLSGASTTNSIYFGDVNDNDAGSIVYTHGTDMAFTVETAEVLTLAAASVTNNVNTFVGNGYGAVIGHTAQETISDGGGATDVVPEFQILGTAAADMTAMIGGWSTTATRAAAPVLALVKSGHASIGSHTVVTDGEILGSIIAYGDDGTDLEAPAAAIEFAVDGTPGTGDMPGEIKFYTTADSGETLTLALTLSAAQAATFAGAVTVASLACTAEGTFGGGYGDTGATISTAGVIQANGAITSDGAVTGATLAGTISTATQNSITTATSLASVGTITSGTWSGVISPESLVGWDDSVETGTDENAQRLIFVDLDDPLQLWDYAEFMQQIQDTSWHDELGDPPVHGLMWVNEAQDKVVWWNRETAAIYMEFEAGSTDMARNVPTAIAFLDAKLYIASGTGSAVVVDFLGDGAELFRTDGYRLYQSTIANRNAGSDYLLYNSSPAIVNNTVNDIAAVRDPDLTDEFGRPKHWWAVGTNGGTSVYNPSDDAIYDAAITAATLGLDLSSNGDLSWTTSGGTRDQLDWMSIFSVGADSFTGTGQWDNNSADAEDLAWANGDVMGKPQHITGASWASSGGPQIYLPSTAVGGYILHTNSSDNAGQGGQIRLDEAYASPYMKGNIIGAWPLHAVTDVSPTGLDLTNNNTVTFVDGGPPGSYANFVAASSMSLTHADDADLTPSSTDTYSLGCWLYRDLDSGAAEGIMGKWDNGDAGDRQLQLEIGATDLITFSYNGPGVVVSTGPAIATGQWYYVVATGDGVTQRLYLNGALVDADASTGNMANGTEIFVIGANTSGDTPEEFFDGRIGGAFFTATTMTEREIRAEYVRGLRRLNSGVDVNDTISDNDVAAIAADPHGKYVAVMGDDKVVYTFDEFAVPIATDTYPGTTARDVAIKSMPGGPDPHIIMAGSDQIEIVQPDVRGF